MHICCLSVLLWFWHWITPSPVWKQLTSSISPLAWASNIQIKSILSTTRKELWSKLHDHLFSLLLNDATLSSFMAIRTQLQSICCPITLPGWNHVMTGLGPIITWWLGLDPSEGGTQCAMQGRIQGEGPFYTIMVCIKSFAWDEPCKVQTPTYLPMTTMI